MKVSTIRDAEGVPGMVLVNQTLPALSCMEIYRVLDLLLVQDKVLVEPTKIDEQYTRLGTETSPITFGYYRPGAKVLMSSMKRTRSLMASYVMRPVSWLP